MRKTTFILIFVVTGLVLYAETVNAQQQSDKWTFRQTPYMIGAAMDGAATIAGQTATVDVGFDQILENLQFGAMLHCLAAKGPWSLALDGIYMGLGQTADQPPAEVNVDQWMVELSGGSQLKPWLHLLVGLRYNLISSEIAFQGSLGKAKGGNVDWIDPIFGARLAGQFGKRWTMRGRTDIGGFGIGSNLTWQLAAYIDFRASNLIAILGGYRYLSNDYETGSGDDLFHYDVDTSGPALGVSFLF